MNKPIIITLFLLFASSLSLVAQNQKHEVIASSGDCFESGDGSISWTLGETVVEDLADGTLTQGFHQPQISVLTGIEALPIGVSVFPNPVCQELKFENKSQSSLLSVSISDMQGKLLESRRVGSIDRFDFSDYARGQYTVVFKDETQKTYTVTVLKK